ncbi:KEX1 protease precursor [Eremomyces bilateralis CBS 781.70]|uniref:KEX1 protease n=1 Tax=Eremomyces bilateralis CBS 781.70 TaxID=1392243 RepID=A0A6G1G6Y2_9PEZI|nr:KEX1 protease precursor [Eremomyces bilateralis CBS 781.70]KAF1813711.1 KEX1 protease precursor [Eremomyces bilateralis CBS 781.70]
MIPRIFLALSLWVTAVPSIASAHQVRNTRDHEQNDYYAVHLDGSTSPRDFASHLNLRYEGEVGALDGHHVFSAPRHIADVVDDAVEELKWRRRKREVDTERHILDGVLLNQKQALRQRLFKRSALPVVESPSKRVIVDYAGSLGIKDPIFGDQWHLHNPIQVGNDLNVTGVWMEGITGKNATVCIIDDGLDLDSDDLKDNYFAAGSYDFNDKSDEPKPRLSDDRHGTRCAGEVAAVRNNVCGVGVAYESRVSGVRILSKPISDIDEAESVTFGFQDNDIYSCSWGPPDDGRTMEGPGILIRRAFVTAVQKGRQGKGTIYVFAAGNGASNGDNCNFDGYTNSIYSITVGAIDKMNQHPYYSEQCSAQLVVTYSSGAGEAIHTTDVGKDTCTRGHGGTSAAGPLAAGVYALVLEQRPDLTWRDMQYLTILTAQPFYDGSQPEEWQDTALGRRFHHQYGYGRLDAYAIVDLAKSWEVVNPQAWFHSPWIHVRHGLPQGDQGLASSFDVTEDMLKDANFERVEHITVTMNVPHQRRGDLSVELHSPTGLVSYLSVDRPRDDAAVGYVDWTFMSVVHWGESGVGTWTIIVKDRHVNEFAGTFQDWKLRLWGESIDADKQGLLPMPLPGDDSDHDDDPSTVTASPDTTSVGGSPVTSVPGNPTDHIDRPSKPSSAGAPPSDAPEASGIIGADPSASPSAVPDSSFLPSPFPTFGVSKKTQIWIYAAMGLIVAFVIGLCIALVVIRWRKRRNPRDVYEFDVLPDEEESGEREGMIARRGKGRRRRAGELYDAFAGESEEELFSEEDEEPYQDEKVELSDAEEDSSEGSGSRARG